jgi:hypothetical protein
MLSGGALDADFTAKVRVPDIESRFKIADANTEILQREDGELE